MRNEINELIKLINENVRKERRADAISYIWSDKLNSVMTGEDTNDLRKVCRECEVLIIDVLNKVRDNSVKVKELVM